ncbi:hypothetical protein HY091_00865 [Candidatus Kaiserbacteria bacterium]|nr:hypothetical protein [Candidatus Kaiserbacteria bacterium]
MFKLKPPVLKFLEQFCSVHEASMNHSEIFRMVAHKEYPNDPDLAQELGLRVRIFTLPSSFRIKQIFVGYPIMDREADPCVIEFLNKQDEFEFQNESQARMIIEDEIVHVSSVYQQKLPWRWFPNLWERTANARIATAALDALAEQGS